MKTLADRIRRLSPGYQGMDDQGAIAREVEELESRLAWAEGMLERASTLLRQNQDMPEVWDDIVTWQSERRKAGPGGERDE